MRKIEIDLVMVWEIDVLFVRRSKLTVIAGGPKLLGVVVCIEVDSFLRAVGK